jgi:Restriction endonuclease NotI
MLKQPIAEAFGFPIDNLSTEAERHRKLRLCPFGNKVPNCTKDKANDPLGVCTIHDGDNLAITCPVRFRENWQIAEDAAHFFFPTDSKWTSLTEIKLKDKNGNSAGNIDVVLVSYDDRGQLLDFGALEVQGVYVSGNIRRPFEQFMTDPATYRINDFKGPNYPRADYVSSSRKRLAPQLIYKGGILSAWGKKQAVAVHSSFMASLPNLREASVEQAQVAWLVYDLTLDTQSNRYTLKKLKTIYTEFDSALNQITTSAPGPIGDFERHLQERLDERLEDGETLNAPDAPALNDVLEQ